MATVPTLVSLEEYLSTSYSPDVDYVDGELQERNVGQYDHSTFQIAIGSYFWVRRVEWSIHPMTEQRIRVSEGNVRVADVVVTSAHTPRETITVTPPIVCIEILSPDDRMTRAKRVLGDYLAMGAKAVWLIDPIRRAAWTFDEAGLHEADPANLAVTDSPVRLDLTEAFSAID